ncbi:MAG: hypothetical protein H0T53_15995 [Herpetosiphonaceae bacterium]|nr:hypothetical protein [Herpetosiphonaceae bacterium]
MVFIHKQGVRIAGVLALMILVIVGTLAHTTAQAAEERKCFGDVPLITDCIEGRFLRFWEANGGLSVFGYPITGAFEQVNEDTGQVYLTQYFERQRFELHPENSAPYDVLLGRLGAVKVDWASPNWREEDARARSYGFPEMPLYFEETKQNVGENLAAFWQSNGLDIDGRAGKSRAESVSLFGMPLRAEKGSSAKPYTWQVYERAILEYHPEMAGRPVLGDRLGVWYVQTKCAGRLGANLFNSETCARVAGIAYP